MEAPSPTTPTLKWMSTAARSGKMKDKIYDVPANHVNNEHHSKSQRQYKVRFKSNIASKRGKVARKSVVIRDAFTTASVEELALKPDEEAPPSDASHRLFVEAETPAFSVGDGHDDCTALEADDMLLENDQELRDYDCLNQVGVDGNEADYSISGLQDNTPTHSLNNITTISAWRVPAANGPDLDRRFYLQYYIEKVVSRLMPLWATPDNPFICIVVPASMDSPILMNAVTAISAYHHEINAVQKGNVKHSGPRINAIGVTALRHKQKVLSLLREDLTKPEILQDPATLAACMLMQTFEVLCSGTSGWDHWLKGATLFIQMRGQLEIDLRSSNSWIRLIKSVVAVETFAGTSADLDMVVSTKYWEIYRREREQTLKDQDPEAGISGFGEDQHFEQLIGCPAVVVYALGQMLVAIRARREADEARTMTLEWLTKWNNDTAKLEDLLLRWKPTNPDKDRVHLTESFRHASLVYYCHHVRCLPYSHTSLQFHVKQTFEHLLALGSASQLEGIALWPTMMAAIDIDEQKSPELMATAIERIRVMASQNRDPIYKHADEALNMIWNRRMNASCMEDRLTVKWEDLNYEMNWKWCMV